MPERFERRGREGHRPFVVLQAYKNRRPSKKYHGLRSHSTLKFWNCSAPSLLLNITLNFLRWCYWYSRRPEKIKNPPNSIERKWMCAPLIYIFLLLCGYRHAGTDTVPDPQLSQVSTHHPPLPPPLSVPIIPPPSPPPFRTSFPFSLFPRFFFVSCSLSSNSVILLFACQPRFFVILPWLCLFSPVESLSTLFFPRL